MSYPRYQLPDAAKAPGGSNLQEAVSAKLDDFFSEYMELYAAVRAERVEAHAALNKGFFAIAEARHAKPGIALDSTAYSGREMLPLHAWSARSVYPPEEGETLPMSLSALAKQCARQALHFEPMSVELKEEDAEDEAEAAAAESKADGIRQRSGKGDDSAVAAASAPAATSDAAVAAPVAALDLRTSPLQWFGVLAPPSLPTAAESFRASLAPLARVASLAQRMRELEHKFAALSALQQASHVDSHALEQLQAVLDKIKISDERKRKEKEAQEAGRPQTEALATAAEPAAAAAAPVTAAAAPAAAASS